MNLILILQGMDMIFTRLIFLPALIILYFNFVHADLGPSAPAAFIIYV